MAIHLHFSDKVLLSDIMSGNNLEAKELDNKAIHTVGVVGKDSEGSSGGSGILAKSLGEKEVHPSPTADTKEPSIQSHKLPAQSGLSFPPGVPEHFRRLHPAPLLRLPEKWKKIR